MAKKTRTVRRTVSVDSSGGPGPYSPPKTFRDAGGGGVAPKETRATRAGLKDPRFPGGVSQWMDDQAAAAAAAAEAAAQPPSGGALWGLQGTSTAPPPPPSTETTSTPATFVPVTTPSSGAASTTAAKAKPRPKVNLEKIARGKGKAAKMARNAIAARTIARAGAGRADFGTSGSPTALKTVGVTDQWGDPVVGPDGAQVTREVPDIPSGSVGYGGQTYNRENLEGLARSLNRNGQTMSGYLANNPSAQGQLGLSDKAMRQFLDARRLTSAARRAARRAKVARFDADGKRVN